MHESWRKLKLGAGGVALALALAMGAAPSFADAPPGVLVVGQVAEPKSLDPQVDTAANDFRILVNLFDGLVQFKPGTLEVEPALAKSWTISDDGLVYTFKLREGVKFQDGTPFDADAVKFTFDRMLDKANPYYDTGPFPLSFLFSSIKETKVIDPLTVQFTLNEPFAPLLANLAGPTGAIVSPAAVKLAKVTIRFISDPAAQVAALLSGDVDAFPRVAAARSLAQFKADPRFNVQIGGSKAKTIVSINERHKPLDDVRVRRAILAAIDRKAMIDGAVDGFGTPIGSFYVPGSLGYVDTTGINPYDPEKAKKLLAEAGVKTPLELSLKLPPPSYARQGGEILAAQLAKVGINAKIENVEWAQWLSQVFTPSGPHNYDLTIVSHVEPFDLVKMTESDYYFGYNSPAFNALYKSIITTPDEAGRAKLLGDAQRMLATDAVAGFLFQPQLITITNKKLKGVWKEVPLFENDFSSWHWE
jgi:peptide/nickel transport system substrate-binding protein